MAFDPGKNWERKGDDLFIHESGVRITKCTYREKPGWWIFPVDLDVPATEFPPTDEGRAQAFAAFAAGLPKPKSKAQPKSAPKKKPILVPDNVDPEADPADQPAAEATEEPREGEDDDEDEKDEDEDDEKESAD